MVGENGAFYFQLRDGKLGKRFQDEEATRREKRSRLDAVARRILAEVPGCAIASDQPYRETDLAIDYCEDVPALPLEAAERIAALMHEAGLTAKVSSIHVNGWFGDYDKLAMTRQLAEEAWGLGASALGDTFVFVGDSPNDAPMFSFFRNSVGVANVRRFAGHLASQPRYITREESGAGFAELVSHLLAAR